MQLLGFKVPFMNVLGAGSAAPPEPVEITTTEFDVEYSTASTIQLEATGGTGPYTFALDAGSPPLPTGCTLNADGTITGDFEVVGTFSPIVIATDSLMEESDPTEITIDVALPAALSGAILILRAQTYDADTGNWPSDISPSTLIFEQATESARPAEGSDAAGPLVNFGGDDYLIGNAAVVGLTTGLDGLSILTVSLDNPDLTLGVVHMHRIGAGNGLNFQTSSASTGSFRTWERRGSTDSTIPTRLAGAGTISGGGTSARNSANQPVVWKGSGSTAGSTTTADVAFSATTWHWIGATSDPAPANFYTGSLKIYILFNKALSAAEMQAAQEYIEDKAFFATSGVTLWA